MHRIILFLFTCLLFSSCFKTPEGGFGQEEIHEVSSSEIEDYWIKFYKIDNQVKVYVNSKEVFDSNTNGEKIEKEISFGLTKYLSKGNNQIKIELYNDPLFEGYTGFDKHWELFYELFKKDIPVEYFHEKDDDGQHGRILFLKHEIEVE